MNEHAVNEKSSGCNAWRKDDSAFVIGLLFVTLAARLSLIFLTSGPGPFFEKYFWLAQKLAHAGWVSNVVFDSSPLYIYLVGLFHVVLGGKETLMRVVQAFVSLATILLWWSYSRELFGTFVARTVALILALYPTIVLYDTQPLPFVWVNLTNASALYALHRAQLRESWRLAALSGCLWGLSALLRPNILMLIPFLLLALVLAPGGRRKGFRLAAVLILATAATISPITFMNVRADGSRSLVTGSGGSTLFIGNMLGAPGVGFPKSRGHATSNGTQCSPRSISR